MRLRFQPKKIERLRKSVGLSRDALAYEFQRLNYNATSRTISNWEKGDTMPGVDDIAALCEIFGKPVTYFFI